MAQVIVQCPPPPTTTAQVIVQCPPPPTTTAQVIVQCPPPPTTAQVIVQCRPSPHHHRSGHCTMPQPPPPPHHHRSGHCTMPPPPPPPPPLRPLPSCLIKHSNDPNVHVNVYSQGLMRSCKCSQRSLEPM